MYKEIQDTANPVHRLELILGPIDYFLFCFRSSISLEHFMLASHELMAFLFIKIIWFVVSIRNVFCIQNGKFETSPKHSP